MARPIWTGSVAFGLVNVPVAVYTATEDKTVHFNQFQEGTSDRIRHKRVNERTGREVAGGKSTARTPAKRGSGARAAGRGAAGGGTKRTRSSGKSGAKAKSSPKRKAS